MWEIESVTNLIWNNAEHTAFDCFVVFSTGPMASEPDPIPFTCSQSDTELHSVAIWNNAANGDYGAIAEYVPPSGDAARALMPSLETWKLEAALLLHDETWDVPAAIAALPVQQRVIYNSQWRNRPSFDRLDPFVVDGVCVWFPISPEVMDIVWNEGLAI